VGLGALVSRLDRWAARVNRWFGGTAVATNVADSGAMSGGSSAVDPIAVVAVLGEIETERDPEEDR
jgi:hypothetical protein